MDRPWPRIIALWLLGVAAAAQLAKISTVAPLVRAAFHLSLPQIGLLISLLEVGGGLFGFVAGLALGRAGARRFLLLGLATLALASLAEAAAPGAAILFAARAIEGIGYVLVVIAAPTAIAAITDDRHRPRALALWSSFVPVGLAVGGAITGVAVGPLGVRGIMLLWAVLIAGCLPVVARLPIAGAHGQPIRLPAIGAWISTFGFGLYTALICALTMLLPIFLIERHGASIAGAGLIAALASLAALPGAMIAMGSMRGGGLRAARVVTVSIPALLLTVPLVLLLYSDHIAGLVSGGAIAVLVVVVSGIVPPLLFARLPVLAGAIGADDPRIATANGLLTQFGAGGALIGPPLGGLIVARSGWFGLGCAIAALTIALLLAVLLAEYCGARTDHVRRMREAGCPSAR